jgi:hypothetical protein
VRSALNTVTNAIPTSSGDVKSQLAAANDTIAQLKKQVEDQGLRQRKTNAVNSDSKDKITSGALGVQNHATEGVPVQIVAGLCLLSFLLAYLFF